ncbi:hypothetical protein EBR11_05360 [bacterium]|nr:hypothetical protein [bacterium]
MHPSTLRGIRYARSASYLFAALIAALGILDLVGGWAWGSFHIPPRWQPETVHYPLALQMECWFFIFYALLIVAPWEKIQDEKNWRKLFALLCLFSIVFAFVMISEVMAKNYIANAAKTKARIPVFQAILLFAALGQIPTLLFVRKPEWVD